MGEQQLRFLVVTAHPHDFTHCAGTCGVHTALGDTVTLVSVTGGAGTHNERLAEELAKPPEQRDPALVERISEEYMGQKAEELRGAAALFGVNDVRILGFPDQPFILAKNPEAVDILRDVILEVRPDVLIAQSPYLRGPHGLVSGVRDDHTETAFVTLEARAQAAVPRQGAEEAPHTIAATYYPGVYFQPDEYDFVVDTSDWADQRVQAEEMFKSQGHTPAFARRRIELASGRTGWFAGTMYAEAWVREKPELVSRITVSDYVLRAAAETPATHLKRISGELTTEQ